MHRQRPHPLTSPPPPRASRPDTPTLPTHIALKQSRLAPTVLKSRFVLFNFLFCITLILLDTTPFSCARFSRQSYLISTSALRPSPPSDHVLSLKPKLLQYDDFNFTLNGHPIRLVSGSVHYFRIPPSRWRPTLLQARRMGLNAIDTYVPWNLHEPTRGVFRFSGMLDLGAFLSLAQELGFLVLLRPGPYICAEVDFGGLPAYLLSDPEMVVRMSHAAYLRAVRRYVTAVSEVVEPFVGRPVVALQIENEYGRAASPDESYIESLRVMWNNAGLSKDRLVHFTSDNGKEDVITTGSPFKLRDVLKTINFGSRPRANMMELRGAQPNGPRMVGELWVGWYDHWGTQHHTRSPEHVAAILREVLFDHVSSVNMYMFAGGTSFGFLSGANEDREKGYEADTTSYDYDAFVSEHGATRTPKFDAVRAVLRDFWVTQGDTAQLARMDEALPAEVEPKLSAYGGRLAFTASGALRNMLDAASAASSRVPFPVPAEVAGSGYGYVLYRHELDDPLDRDANLQVAGVRDFAVLLYDGVVRQAIERKHPNDTTSDGGETPTNLKISEGVSQIDILVENSGRVNYGPGLIDRKGLLGNVTLDEEVLEGFDVYSLSFPQDHPWIRDIDLRSTITDTIAAMRGVLDHPPTGESASQPVIFHATLIIDPAKVGTKENEELPSTFCKVLGRGTLWVNGFNVGKFNTDVAAPQRSLFIPGSLLKAGSNDIVVLQLEMQLMKDPPSVEFFDQPDYGPQE